MKAVLIRYIGIPFEILALAGLAVCALAARFTSKKIDIGLGPLPLINNIYHKKVFQQCGYSAETFVNQLWHITTDFDVRGDTHPLASLPKIGYRLNILRFAAWTYFRYRCVLLYFDGGPLGIFNTVLLWRTEPFLYRLAGVKTLVLAYGSDVQDMSRSGNLLFKHVISKDYPLHRKARKRIADKIDVWTTQGDHVVGGCEWVDYMYYWDTLMISHFSIDVEKWVPQSSTQRDKTMRILHAPNHRNIKGTDHVIAAIESLKAEGYDIELILAEKKPNSEIQAMMAQCDVVIDQLIVGWYAMFAIEAMAMEKPVICHYRRDLEELYRTVGLLDKTEGIPLIDSSPLRLKDTLKELYGKKQEFAAIGKAGRHYVEQHHSLEAVAKTFGPIAEKLIGKPAGIRG